MDEIKKSFLPNVDIKEYLLDKGVKFKDAGRWVHCSCFWPEDHTHGDKDASFSIDTEALAYNCFGCHKSGTWTHLCEQMGWEIDIQPLVDQVNRALWADIRRGLESMKDDIEPVNHITFHLPQGYRPIAESTEALKYMKERGFTEETLETFEIGYSKPVEDPDYGKAYYDRIIIPVSDEGGTYIWPEGRSLKGDGAKYWRPKGTKKELFLYNFQRIRDLYGQFVIIVEGIMDPIILHQWELPAVATFGSDLSDRQTELLVGRFTEIFWCQDTDKAGIESWKKHSPKLTNSGCTLYKITLPRGEDPNSLGKDEFIKYLDKAEKFY